MLTLVHKEAREDVNEIRKQSKLIGSQFPTSHHSVYKYVCF